MGRCIAKGLLRQTFQLAKARIALAPLKGQIATGEIALYLLGLPAIEKPGACLEFLLRPFESSNELLVISNPPL